MVAAAGLWGRASQAAPPSDAIAHAFAPPPAAPSDPWGPRPDGITRVALEDLLTYVARSPIDEAAQANVDALRAEMSRTKFAWVPRVSSELSLAPGRGVQCDDLTLAPTDPRDPPFEFQYCRPRGDEGADLDSIAGYYRELRHAGVQFRASVDLWIPLFGFGRLRQRLASARQRVALAGLERERMRLDRIRAALEAHSGLIAARASIAILARAWHRIKSERRQFRAPGALSPLHGVTKNEGRGDPFLLAELDTTEVEMAKDIDRARAIEARALATLWALAGDAAPRYFDIAERNWSPAPDPADLTELIERAMQRRPQAKMASARIASQKAAERLARTQFFPEFAVLARFEGAVASHADRATSLVYAGRRQNFGRLTLSLNMRWDLAVHDRAFGLRRARALLRRADALRAYTHRMLAVEVEAAHRSFMQSRARRELSRLAIRRSRRSLDLVTAELRAGRVAPGEFTQQLRRHVRARLDAVADDLAANVAHTRLTRAVGGPVGDDPADESPRMNERPRHRSKHEPLSASELETTSQRPATRESGNSR